ncbi:MAG: hypothetical protein NC206_02950, partial [Bacteroides sp.]|nr:hypothetical protein [Bacteroides sp.]
MSKLQGAENLFSAHTDFFCKAHKIYFQGAPVLKSPFFRQKSDVFQGCSLKNTVHNFFMLRKTKMKFEPENRWY